MMQFNDKEKKELMYCNSCYVLGTLAEEVIYSGNNEPSESVSIMKNSNNVMFHIKTLSDEPIPISNYINPYTPIGQLYVGVDVHQNQGILPSGYQYTSNMDQKIEIVKNRFKNKVVLFKPHITFKEGRQYPFKNIEIITVETDIEINSNTQFICIPKVNMDNKTFEQKLLNGNNILLEDYNHFMLLPEYILCGDYLYSNFKSWDKHCENKRMWLCSKEQDKIKKIKLTVDNDKIKNKIIRGTDNLIFIESDYVQEHINNEFDEEGQYISNNDDYVFAKSTEETIEEEINFLKDLKQYTVENNLCYDTKDLINFHISLKTNPLTIVAGMSGTGKTQLARSYAKVLGLSEEDGTLLFLPISPSYTEPEDLLGYLNTTNGLYMSSETGMVDFLISAENNGKKCIILFDEMNLSQVEHWFSPFISLLELECEERKLKLYNKSSICHNCEKYKSTIHIADNITFIGTVNLDETTKDFSDRLLDRANIVTLQKQSFVSLKQEQGKIKNKVYKSKEYSFEEYSSWIKSSKQIALEFSMEELNLLDKLHNTIQKYDTGKGVSFRIFEKMGSYLMNIPIDSEKNYSISRKDAIDIQIKQRLLTKIKGTERQFKKLIGTIKNDESENPLDSELYNLFSSEEAQKISHFTLTKKEICRKARELSLYGYAN